MIAAVLLAAALIPAMPTPAPLPLDGTLTYSLEQHGKIIGTSRVVFRAHGAQVLVQERAAIGALQVTTDTTLDAATLHELSYAGSSPQQGSFSVSQSPGVATIHSGATTVRLAAISGSPLMIIGDGLVSTYALLPAILNATGATHFTLAAINGVKALPVVVTAARGVRPRVVRASDVGTQIAVDGTTKILWYNPFTFRLRALTDSNGVIEIRLTGSSPSTRTVPIARATAPPTPLPLPRAHYSSRNVTFAAAGNAMLAGTVTIPNGADSALPVIVMAPGSGPEDRDETVGPNKIFLQLANALSNHGYVVVRYDKRGIGGSTGDHADLRANALADITAAFHFAQTLSGVDPKRIYLLGHSEGGATVPIVAADNPGIRGIILLAPPAIRLPQISLEQATRGLHGKSYARTRSAEVAALAAIEGGSNAYPGAAFLRSWASYNPSTTIARVRCPILVVQGTKDFQILPSDLPPLVKAAKRADRNITVRLLPGDDHLFLNIPGSRISTLHEYFQPSYIDPALAATILAWLRTH